jgi:hypothetical protein
LLKDETDADKNGITKEKREFEPVLGNIVSGTLGPGTPESDRIPPGLPESDRRAKVTINDLSATIFDKLQMVSEVESQPVHETKSLFASGVAVIVRFEPSLTT